MILNVCAEFFFQNISQNIYEYDAMCVIKVLPAVIIRVPH